MALMKLLTSASKSGFIMDQIQHLQQHLRDAEQAHNAEVEDYFYHHSLHYSREVISVTAVQVFVVPFDPFEVLNFTEER